MSNVYPTSWYDYEHGQIRTGVAYVFTGPRAETSLLEDRPQRQHPFKSIKPYAVGELHITPGTGEK